MSHIAVQQDNITILTDVYETTSVTSYKEGIDKEPEIEKIHYLLLQIIISVNGKQKVFCENFSISGKMFDDWQKLNILINFIKTIGYDFHIDVQQIVDDHFNNTIVNIVK